MQSPNYPGTVEPEREGVVESAGIALHYAEWGDPKGDPLVLCHGMWDHARGFAVLAPLLARRYRVVALDARGHGESEWAPAYSWPTDVADIVSVLRSLGRPAHLVGHSKGGGQVTDAAAATPEMVRKVVNIDGFGPPPFGPEDVATPERCRSYLDARRTAAERGGWRPYPSLDDLVERRRVQNPRLSREWLRYFVYHAAREAQDGWRWKSDPLMAHGFGPWSPDWIAPAYAHMHRPVLAIVGSERDTWGPLPEPLLGDRLRVFRDLKRATIRGAGHFVHMEQPVETARVILEFLES